MAFSLSGFLGMKPRMHRQRVERGGGATPSTILEQLEPRLLLSGAVLGKLPVSNDTVEYAGQDVSVYMPVTEHAGPAFSVSGTVFADVDQDGIWDPNEHALFGVQVFADVNGNKVRDDGERAIYTGNDGGFMLAGLPTGHYDIRAVLPEGYKPSAGSDESSSVSITPAEGVAGLSIGLVRSGFDISVHLSEVTLAQSYQTGKRVKIPVIIKNTGDTALPAGKLRLALFLSSDGVRNAKDWRLKVFKIQREVGAGETFKTWLRLKLPDSLADFNSYLIVQAGGRYLQSDLNQSDHIAVSAESVLFKASKRRATIDADQVDTVIDNWNSDNPYGGYTPGFGYDGGLGGVGGGTVTINPGWTYDGGTSISIGGTTDSYFGIRSYNIEGEPATVSGVFFHDRNANGVRDANEQGLSGMQVRVSGTDRIAITGSDGRFEITGIPTEVKITETYYFNGGWEVTSRKNLSESIYLVVDVPDGWRSSEYLSLTRKVSVYSGCNVGNINFGIYALPQIERVVVDGEYISQTMPTTITAQGVYDPDGTVERVVFFYDDDMDGWAEDVLGIDNNGSDGFSINIDGLRGFEPGSESKVIAIAEDNDGHLCQAVTKTELRHVYEVSADKSLAYREADGTIVTLKMAGAGSAYVSMVGDGLIACDLGGVIELSGHAVLLDIELNQTTAETGLSVLTSKAKGTRGRAEMLGSVYGSSLLGALAASKLDMTAGGIQMSGQGAIERLAIGSINGILMPGRSFKKGLRINAGRVTGDVTLDSPLARFKALNMTGVDLSAPLADEIVIKKDYDSGSITLDGYSLSVGVELLRVGGEMRDVTVNTMASIDTIQVGSMINSSVQVGSETISAGMVQTASDFTERGAIQHLSVLNGVFANSYVSAWEIGVVRLETVLLNSSRYAFGLTYHTLESYQGPDGLVMKKV